MALVQRCRAKTGREPEPSPRGVAQTRPARGWRRHRLARDRELGALQRHRDGVVDHRQHLSQVDDFIGQPADIAAEVGDQFGAGARAFARGVSLQHRADSRRLGRSGDFSTRTLLRPCRPM
jgi:hypothetical protein